MRRRIVVGRVDKVGGKVFGRRQIGRACLAMKPRERGLFAQT